MEEGRREGRKTRKQWRREDEDEESLVVGVVLFRCEQEV